MINNRNLILILAVIGIIVAFILMQNQEEHFNEKVGRFCLSCHGKTINECLGCFNCGYCIDENGNGQCIGGDHRGPYNYERCAYWYSGDPFSRMMQRNADYKLSYGPMQANRVI
jgi:hypothetical protein